MRILDYDKLLYPQCLDDLRVIPTDVMENLQKEAQNKLLQIKQKYNEWVRQYSVWQQDMNKFKEDVIEFQKKNPQYPTYAENPGFYKHVTYGTQKEWDAEQEKELSGFLFEPRKPCEPSIHPNTIAHWKSLAEGKIPSGFQVEN